MAEYPSGTKIPRREIEAARKHLFLCIGPDCCASAEGEKLWDFLKRECRTLQVPVLRTKAACLRICQGGPWMVVYPEGIWYGSLTPDRLQRILSEHIENDRPVEEWIVVRSCH